MAFSEFTILCKHVHSVILDGLPQWLSGKESACRGHGFDPWVGKISWRQSTPPFLPEKSHGQGSLAGHSPHGRKELDITEGLSDAHVHAHTHTHTIPEHTHHPIKNPCTY